jgi:uncharacterized protein
MKNVGIRSVTYSVNLDKINNREYVNNIKSNLDIIINEFKQSNIFIRTIRFNIVSDETSIINDQFLFIRKIELLSCISKELNVRWFNVSFDLTNEAKKYIITYTNLAYQILSKFKNSFVNLVIAKSNTIAFNAANHAASTIIKNSKISVNGFDNFRFGISLNPNENTPFFPFTYANIDHNFSLAMEITKSFEKIVRCNKTKGLESIQKEIISQVGGITTTIEDVCKKIEYISTATYVGQDLSLAPYPDEKISVVETLNLLGLENFGANGTLFFTSFITDTIKEIINRNNLKSVGFNGIMYSLLEDHMISISNNKKMINIDSLILYSSLCGCGLDMVPVPGNILEEELASIIIDIASLSTKLNKPLGLRVLPIPNTDANEFTSFDMDFLSNTRVLNVKNYGCDPKIFEIYKYSFYNINTAMKNKTDLDKYQDEIKNFWDKRAEKYLMDNSLSATNLEENQTLQKIKLDIEREKILKLITFNKNDLCLDLGCGIGVWAELMSSHVNEVIGVDYSKKMIDIAVEKAYEKNISNIKYYCKDAAEFKSKKTFNIIFISGLLLYFSDNKLTSLLSELDKYSETDTRLILREPTGIYKQHLLLDKYSESLKVNYSAVYRTRNELVTCFENIGFKLLNDEDMFPPGNPLNKWKETKLRIYSFIKL